MEPEGWGELVLALTQNGEEVQGTGWLVTRSSHHGTMLLCRETPGARWGGHSSVSRNLGLKLDWFSGLVKLEYVRFCKHLYT